MDACEWGATIAAGEVEQKLSEGRGQPFPCWHACPETVQACQIMPGAIRFATRLRGKSSLEGWQFREIVGGRRGFLSLARPDHELVGPPTLFRVL